MKKRIFAALAAVCLMAGTSAIAQPAQQGRVPKERPTAEQMAQRLTDRMTRELGLNEQQTKQVYDLNLARVRAMEQQRQQMQAARTAEAEKMKGILTTDQFMRWSQMEGPQFGKHRGQKHGGPKACCDDSGKPGKGCCMQGKGGKGPGKGDGKRSGEKQQ